MVSSLVKGKEKKEREKGKAKSEREKREPKQWGLSSVASLPFVQCCPYSESSSFGVWVAGCCLIIFPVGSFCSIVILWLVCYTLWFCIFDWLYFCHLSLDFACLCFVWEISFWPCSSLAVAKGGCWWRWVGGCISGYLFRGWIVFWSGLIVMSWIFCRVCGLGWDDGLVCPFYLLSCYASCDMLCRGALIKKNK